MAQESGLRIVEPLEISFQEQSAMQHPFEGVMGAGPEKMEARPTRRSVLGRMLGAMAALFGTAAAASARAPRRPPTTLALGEEGGGITTMAWREEGGWWCPLPRGEVTTFALGEEGGYAPPPARPISPVPPSRRPTTQALGEEGGQR
jgi:hypothetical protein